jgi:hypothetical protein
VFARVGKILIIAALVVVTGAHWAALQTVAWTTMFAANLSSQQSLTEAVSETFDGKHLCPLCRAIAAAKNSEKKSEAVARTMKMEFPLTAGKIILLLPSQFELQPQNNCFAKSFFLKPPLQPPRGFCV